MLPSPLLHRRSASPDELVAARAQLDALRRTRKEGELAELRRATCQTRNHSSNAKVLMLVSFLSRNFSRRRKSNNFATYSTTTSIPSISRGSATASQLTGKGSNTSILEKTWRRGSTTSTLPSRISMGSRSWSDASVFILTLNWTLPQQLRFQLSRPQFSRMRNTFASYIPSTPGSLYVAFIWLFT